ncbi:MAG: SusC/RagA family TonB-linked outer membrane protein [Marinifilaceae bacterium]
MSLKQYMLVLLLCAVNLVYAQEPAKLSVRGKVYSSINNTPMAGVSVLADNLKGSVLTDAKGEFVIEATSVPHTLVIKYPGFHDEEIRLNKRTHVEVYMIPLTLKGYPQELLLPLRRTKNVDKTGISSVVEVEDGARGHIFVDELLTGTIAGVRTLQKGGMPGEGNFVSIRGTRSLTAQNTPLIVIDGMPIISNQNPSMAFTGYSRNIMNSVSIKELSDITIAKGFDASLYGSAAANGVLMINTENASDMDTRVEIETVNGVNFVGKTLSMLDGNQFKQYFTQLGLSAYQGDEFVSKFPFMDANYKGHTYNNNTDWQKQIFSPAFTTENVLKVKGGDAIAKYALMAGYLNSGGIMDGSALSRYSLRFNGDMRMTRKFSMFTNMSFSYLQVKAHEQGIDAEVNPLMAALFKPAIESPFKKAKNGEDLNVWAPVDKFRVSNPAMLAKEVLGKNDEYNVLVNLGLNYNINKNLLLKGIAGIHYTYNTDNFFIPGVSSEAILPLEGGRADNTVRNGAGRAMTFYGNASLNYEKDFNKNNNLTVVAGAQFLRYDYSYEYAKGTNTATDYNQSLSSVKDAAGRYLSAYDNTWAFGNYYVNALYGFKKQLYVGVAASADATSVSGENASLFNVYPSANVAWKIKESSILRNQTAISELTLRAEASRRGNSMLPPMLGRYYYEGVRFQNMGGIVRGNIPNNKLKPEYVEGFNVGVDFATRGRKFSVALDLFRDETKDLVVRQDLDDAFGSKFRYSNSGKLLNKGAELSMNVVALRRSNFEWLAGATIAHNKAEITSLGGADELIYTLSDGAQIITRKGDSPYAFYGLKADGVYTTSDKAAVDNYRNYKGKAYGAGDMRFVDQNGDKVINQDDRVVLGDATPDFYGGFYTSFRYKNLSLSARFTYSYGNEIYNAVRRQGESMKDFVGQTSGVLAAWRYEGQETNMPKAVYNDPMENSCFSSRWIEDGSYLKLKNVTLNYSYPNKVWLFQTLQAYVTAENLFTWTKYLGYDPEFAYSYDHNMSGVDYGKVPGATSVKLGLRLGF